MYVCTECGSPAPSAGQCAADGTPFTPIGEDILLGTTIGVYRVARLLGIGGMGRVYKGVHPAIGSRVAIKVLSRECSDRRDLVERFFAEAKAVNVIRHESIVNVLDLATLPDGRPYIIMEYLDGAPLAAIIEHAVQMQRPLPLGGLARLAAEVLDALAAAHAKGIVHRDLKPDNIFVAPSGRPKVLDFGIAKLSDLSTGSSTRTGSLLGTPHYMSPEQAAGKPVDHRSDIYAMGVILFECATGQKPFVGESLFELLRKHVEAPPPAPSSLRPDISPALESVILTALAKPLDQRFASAQAMSAALQHATAQLGADQWTPITSGTISGSAAAPSGWQGTPPAGWGTGHPAPASPSYPPRSSQNAPTTGGGRPPGERGALAMQSTINATTGQVQQPPPPARSRTGLWLGLGAAALAGGGIVFAIANRGDDAPKTATPAEETTRPAPRVDRDEPAKEKDADEPAEPDIPMPDLSGDPSEALEAALKQLDGLDPAVMPPATRKQLEALKGLSKLPPKERMAKLKELANSMNLPDIGDALDAGSAARGKAEADAEADEPPPTPDPPPKPPAGAGSAGAAVQRRSMSYPGYDAGRVDVTAFVRWAIAEAKRADPAAILFRVDVSGVGPDGFANLELATMASEHGSLDLRFSSPPRPDPSRPVGVPAREEMCEFRIEAEPDGVELRPIPSRDCKRNVAIPPPSCTALALWKRALAAKAPQNAVATLGYRAWAGKPRWYFDVNGEDDGKPFSKVFEDDCK